MSDEMMVITQVAPYADGPAGVHGVLPQAERGLVEIGRMAGLRTRVVDDVADVAPEEFRSGVVLALFTIGETPFDAAQKVAIEQAWRGGDLTVLGVHSATDACHEWPAYGDMLGGRFAGHPWTRDFVVDVSHGLHPATAHLGPTMDWHDEVYLFSDFSATAKVLLRVADGQLEMEEEPACGFPLSWCVEAGWGRTFYSALGHFPGAWETPSYLRHLAGGLAWLLNP